MRAKPLERCAGTLGWTLLDHKELLAFCVGLSAVLLRFRMGLRTVENCQESTLIVVVFKGSFGCVGRARRANLRRFALKAVLSRYDSER
jgi:hypothetical protein